MLLQLGVECVIGGQTEMETGGVYKGSGHRQQVEGTEGAGAASASERIETTVSQNHKDH